jgi:hypothetical protein
MSMAKYLIFDGTALVSTNSATSNAIEIKNAAGDFAVALKATGAGADIKVEYEVSQDGTTYDSTTTSPTRTILSSLGVNYLVTGFDVPVAEYVRIKLTGNAGNATENVTVVGRLMFNE